jgi:hypothetical protein
MIFEAQRLRNLTTERLHTKMDDIYTDICLVMGLPSIMTHSLPAANKAIAPWLHKHVKEPSFWDGSYNPGLKGIVYLPDPTPEEQQEMKTLWIAELNDIS